MCNWCENYRFTINATNKKNLIDHGDFYIHANYCPVCGTLLNKNLKNDNDNDYEDYEIEEITIKKPLKKETETKTEEQVYIVKIKPEFVKGPNPEDCYYKGMSTFGDTPLGTDKDGAKYFTSIKALKKELNWFYNPEDYEIITTTRVVVEMPVKEAKVKLPRFTMEDFYLKSDSGSIIRRIYDKDTNKSYEFSSKTIDKFNQIVDKLNSL